MTTLAVQPLALRDLAAAAAAAAVEVAPELPPTVGGALAEALGAALDSWDRHDTQLSAALHQHASSVASAASLYELLEQRLIQAHRP